MSVASSPRTSAAGRSRWTCTSGDDHDQPGTANHLALLVWMNDDDAQWAAGVVQISDDLLKFKTDDSGRRRREYNRDNKRHLNDDGMDSTYWLWGGLQNLPPNPLRRMSQESRRLKSC